MLQHLVRKFLVPQRQRWNENGRRNEKGDIKERKPKVESIDVDKSLMEVKKDGDTRSKNFPPINHPQEPLSASLVSLLIQAALLFLL